MNLRDKLVIIISNLLFSGKSLYDINKIAKSELQKGEEAIDDILSLIISELPKLYPKPGFHPEFDEHKKGFNEAIEQVKTLLEKARK